MKILVSFSKSPATTSKIAFKNNIIQFEDAGVQWIINPYDEWYALVRAIELKEKDATAVIHLITVTVLPLVEQLRNSWISLLFP